MQRSNHDYIILGAGPAGLQLAYHLERSGRDYVVLDRAEAPGETFRRYPRHGKLLSINKRYTGYDDPEINLRWDWNSLLTDDHSLLFRDYSKEYFPDASDMARYLVDYADRFQLNVRCGVEVTQIDKESEQAVFRLTARDGRVFRGNNLIVATGVSRAYIPDIPGVELAESYCDMSVDPEDYAGQRVLIVGKGNSGFETADSLLASTALIHLVSPHPVTFAWKSKYVGHLRATNANFVDTYQLKCQNVILDAEVEEIRREDGEYRVRMRYGHANGEQEELAYDRVLLCTGFRFDDQIFGESCRPALACGDRFPAQTSAWESTNVPGLYFAGVLTQQRDYKKKQSAFIHGFRYNTRALYHHLEFAHHRTPWPSQSLLGTPQTLHDFILRRSNQSSGLWQQSGALCDAIVVGAEQQVRYYEDVSTDYAHDVLARGCDDYYLLTLEFGLEIIARSPDPLAVERIHKDDVARAHESSGIHPIIRRYRRAELLDEHHVIEDVMSEWDESVHREPLLAWLERTRSPARGPLQDHG